MARPSKFTQATIDRLIQAIRLGSSYDLAAMYAGISYETFNKWHKGEFPRGADSALKMQFVDDLMRAEGEGAIASLAKIEKAASEGQWQAAAWKLERRYPATYGRQVRDVNLSGTVTIADLIARADAADKET